MHGGAQKYMQSFGVEIEGKLPLKDPMRRTGSNIDMDRTETRRRAVAIGQFLFMRLDEMWGMSGLCEDVLSYGYGLCEDVLCTVLDYVKTYFLIVLDYV